MENLMPRDGAGAPFFPTDELRITPMDQVTWQTRMSCLNIILTAQPQTVTDAAIRQASAMTDFILQGAVPPLVGGNR